MKVLKFGGTSVGSAEKMKKIAEIIRSERPVFVVLSAMGGTTDKLTGMVADAVEGRMEAALKSAWHLKKHYDLIALQLLGEDAAVAMFYVDII
ncbi:hypothetical protein MNBD_BACTEROID07-1334, partial [hydrothermal vent metagenome]